jgi:uncharacterized protein (DUF302 family)
MIRVMTLNLTLFLTFAGSCQVRAEELYVVYRSSSSFEDVVQALQLAIEEKGLYLNNRLQIGDMLERTGKDLGLGEPLYLKAVSFEFCSALLSRRMTSENPARIINCPYIISVYVLPAEPQTTNVVHRRLDLEDESPVMKEAEAMLESLGRAAAEGF